MAKERYSKLDPEFKQQDHDYYNRYKSFLFPHIIGPIVVDIGCGEGWLTEEIADFDHVSHILAIDKYSGPQRSHTKIQYQSGNIPRDIPIREADTVISTEFIEHITQPDLLELCGKVKQMIARPWAYFIGSTPNKVVETKNPYHLREYTIDELNDVFAQAGFIKRYLWYIGDLTVFKVK